jgi:Na+/H+-dicarboxylate symporter
MMRTATNVSGQALVPTIVAKCEGILDPDRYHAPRGADPLREEQPSTLTPVA